MTLPSPGPKARSSSRVRSTAKFSACRTRTSSKGAKSRVEGDEIGDDPRVDHEVARVLRPHGGDLGRGRADLAPREVGGAVEDGRDMRVRRALDALDDHVRKAVRLRVRRPFAKPRVANEPDAGLGIERRDLVGAGGRHEAVRVKRCSGGDGERGGEIELVQEVGVGRDEVERDRVRAGMGLDALREVARPLRIGQAAPGTDDAGVVRRVVGALARQLERALDGAPEVLRAGRARRSSSGCPGAAGSCTCGRRRSAPESRRRDRGRA